MGGLLAAPWQEPFIQAAVGGLFWGQALQDELFNGLRENADELIILSSITSLFRWMLPQRELTTHSLSRIGVSCTRATLVVQNLE